MPKFQMRLQKSRADVCIAALYTGMKPEQARQYVVVGRNTKRPCDTVRLYFDLVEDHGLEITSSVAKFQVVQSHTNFLSNRYEVSPIPSFQFERDKA